MMHPPEGGQHLQSIPVEKAGGQAGVEIDCHVVASLACGNRSDSRVE